jgi:hypothetical protein
MTNRVLPSGRRDRVVARARLYQVVVDAVTWNEIASSFVDEVAVGPAHVRAVNEVIASGA